MKRCLKCFGLLCLCCMLCSCWRSSTIHDSVDVINNSINALEESLPKECKTKAIKLQFDGLRKQTEAIENDCDKAVSIVTTEKNKWLLLCFIELIIIAVYILKKVIK